ncbi:MAG: type II toxin-antitoxin system RelE/ParE family toxin [Coriobacteriales bacterium]|jgi:plasmid stabilization system protein ParE|nr:type II toxin-antitoxin system RelE/ParE family toxin [Coriobacteriales bacterium]
MLESPDAPYQVVYLPQFYLDVMETLGYIRDVLENPAAARRLRDKLEAAILERSEHPGNQAICPSIRPHDLPYRRIHVGNFSVFYVVYDHTMEVRRFLYARRDLRRIL